MNEEQFAIVRGLVPVAWADGSFADKEKEMLDGLLEAYGASDAQRAALHEYAKERRTLDDIDLQELGSGDRRVLLQCAVLLSFADGAQHVSESTLLRELATKLRIPDEEAKHVVAEAEARAQKNVGLLG